MSSHYTLACRRCEEALLVVNLVRYLSSAAGVLPDYTPWPDNPFGHEQFAAAAQFLDKHIGCGPVEVCHDTGTIPEAWFPEADPDWVGTLW